jgi:hypothetical protein
MGSIRGEVKRNSSLHGRGFSAFQPHVIKQGRFRPGAPSMRRMDTAGQQFRFCIPALFIASSRRSQSALKPTSRTVVRWQPWFYWELVAHSFFGLSRGPRVRLRLGARGSQNLPIGLRLTLEPECPRSGLATARKDPPGWNGIE